MHKQQNSIPEAMAQLLADSIDAEAGRLLHTQLLNDATELQRQRFLRAGRHKRSAHRRGRANGFQAKRLRTRFGDVTVAAPKTRDHPPGRGFYPMVLCRRRRQSKRGEVLIAEMYFRGVSVRREAKVLKELGIPQCDKMVVSRIVAKLDRQLEKWRTRPLGAHSVVYFDARDERVRPMAVLTAVGCTADGRQRALGMMVVPSEAARIGVGLCRASSNVGCMASVSW